MGYFTGSTASNGNLTGLGDLHAQHENALELRRSLARWHDVADTGSNSGGHRGVEYYCGHWEKELPPTGSSRFTETYLDTADTTLFDGALWRLVVSVFFTYPGGTRNLRHQVTWGGAPATTCWNGSSQTAEGTGAIFSGSGGAATTEAGLGSLVSKIAVQSSGRLTAKVQKTGNDPDPWKFVVDFAIFRIG